jgi:hypothetical protein
MWEPDKTDEFASTPWGTRTSFLENKLSILGHLEDWNELMHYILIEVLYTPTKQLDEI